MHIMINQFLPFFLFFLSLNKLRETVFDEGRSKSMSLYSSIL